MAAIHSDGIKRDAVRIALASGLTRVDIVAPLVRATMSTWQTTGFVESLLRLIGLNWEVPDFSTLSRRQKTLAVNIPYRSSQAPLHLLIDSTGIKVEGEGEWNARKHVGPKRRVWRKVRPGIDEQTLEIRAVEVTSSDVGDAPMLPELLSQIPPEQEIASVTADGADIMRKCHDAIAERGARRPSAAQDCDALEDCHNRTSPQALSRATRPCGRRNTLAGRSGDNGAGTNAEAAQKRKCTASNSWASASWRGTSTVR